MQQHLQDSEILLNKIIGERDALTRTISNLENEIAVCDDEMQTLKKVKELFEHLIDTLMEDKKNELQDLVTYGLKTVFPDMNLKFKIIIETKYNTVCTSFLTQNDQTEGDVLDSFGGGVVNLESFLLRLIALFQTGYYKFLFLDESFANLSEEFVENCSLLLRKICEEFQVTIVNITHKDSMLTHAHKVYRASFDEEKGFMVN